MHRVWCNSVQMKQSTNNDLLGQGDNNFGHICKMFMIYYVSLGNNEQKKKREKERREGNSD